MIVCADDFGLRPDIDEAILKLCAAEKLSAVSCMTLFTQCGSKELKQLQEFQQRVDIGLHLCLTVEPPECSPRSSSPMVFTSFASCLWHAQTQAGTKADFFREISSQYDQFVQKAGRPPSHIDGHLHIHQIPAVREALVRFVAALPEENRPYIRNTAHSIGTLLKCHLPFVKAWPIALFGNHMATRLHSADLKTNDGFAGIYDFRNASRFPEFLPRFLQTLPKPNGLLVVHPGKAEPWRAHESRALLESPVTPNRFL